MQMFNSAGELQSWCGMGWDVKRRTTTYDIYDLLLILNATINKNAIGDSFSCCITGVVTSASFHSAELGEEYFQNSSDCGGCKLERHH